MSPAPSSTIWLQLLALLAVEAGLVALVVAVWQRHTSSAAWRRTICQAGVVGILLLTLSELSGSGRLLGGWIANAFHSVSSSASSSSLATQHNVSSRITLQQPTA